VQRRTDPAPKFFGRGNYTSELALDAQANPPTLRLFFGDQFDLADVLAYHPDVPIDRPTELVVGGTRFELLPTRGGETDDAMMVQMPDAGVLFAGDILMPYLGAPFAPEGSLDGMLAGIDQVEALAPRILLHGHQPLTQLFSSTRMLADLRTQLAWLRDAVLEKQRGGADRATIQAANLIAPGLEKSRPDVQIAYLVLRTNVIDRLVEQNSGYWGNGLHGLDALSHCSRTAASSMRS